MKTKLSGILTLFLALFVQLSFAQERTITGTVSDESGPLPGVSVLIEGTTTGTETDFDGNYSITANSGDVLRYSFVGMTTVTRSVGAESTVNVTMVSETNTLDEVVVTALGIKKEKKALGYATTQVDGEKLYETGQGDAQNIAVAVQFTQFGTGHFEILGQPFIHPQWQAWDHRVQVTVGYLVTEILGYPVGESDAILMFHIDGERVTKIELWFHYT